MDPIKIGEFLRELRKEKNLTQQELAEIFMVSNRTISRWETGTNMPDISLLVEIADYYEVDIREIINGERKAESPDLVEESEAKEGKNSDETLREIAGYADGEKEKLATKTRIYALAGLVCMFVFVIIHNFAPTGMLFNVLGNLALIMVYVALASSVIFTTERLQVLRRKYKDKIIEKMIPIILIIIGVIILILLLAPFFMIAEG